MKPLLAADLFCGAGGSSTGLLRAATRLGRNVELLAVNHWPAAVRTHELNHPEVRHLQEDLGAVDPRAAIPGGKLDLLVASPECTSHSYSRGGRPISEQSRASAWHPLRWADQLRVDALLIENVPQFRDWGPTDRRGRPIRSRKGETYRQYLDMLRAMGYTVGDARVLNAADFGAATTRRRLFIIARKGNRPIRWPHATHAPAGSLLPGLQPWRPARDIIDWSLEGRSIFGRAKPLAPKTRERIFMGAEKFWPALRPYLAILRQHMGARSVDDPVPTVAAGGQHIALVEPFLIRYHGDHAGQWDGARRSHPLDAPLPNVDGSNRYGLTAPFLVTVSHGDNGKGSGRGNGGRVRSADEPIRTLTGSREHGVAEAFLVGAGGPSGQGAARSVSEPVRTVLAENHQALVEPFVVVNRSHNAPKSVADPLPVLNTGGHMALVEPFILPHRMFDQMDVDSIDQPMRTITAKGGKAIGLAEPFLVPFFGRAVCPELSNRVALSWDPATRA